MRSGSLSRRLALLVSAGIAAVWLLGVLATALVLRIEQEEMLDLQLRETAQLVLPILAERWHSEGVDAVLPENRNGDPGETLVYLLTDAAGRILLQSPSAAESDLPEAPRKPGYATTATHVFYVTEPDAEGLSAIYGDPRHERAEAYRESFLAFFFPMFTLLPMAYLLVTWIAKTALQPLTRLREEIAARGEGRLDPIDAAGQPEELHTITATINGLMLRLGQTLDSERAFATNAAHELRTPVAVALAQTQRLRAEHDGKDADRIDRIESALNRMSRLVARLLQLARADAGIGKSDQSHDLRGLALLVLDDFKRDPAHSKRLRASLPDDPVLSPVDPDAFAIVASNLIDNALLHSPEGSIVHVEMSADGVLRISNDAPGLGDRDLSGLTRRFERIPESANGFGLGLHIAETIARQSGSELVLRISRIDGHHRFEATLKAPRSQ